MMRNEDVTSLLQAITTKERQIFTRMLNVFEKAHGVKYGSMDAGVADVIFRSCRNIFEKSSDHTHIDNALRTLRVIVSTKEFLQEHAIELFGFGLLVDRLSEKYSRPLPCSSNLDLSPRLPLFPLCQ